MTDKISERLSRQVGVANLVELLSSRLSGTDLHSLNLKILKNRLDRANWSSADLLKAVPVTSACSLDARILNELEGLAYSLAPSFDAIEPSPLLPLGAVHHLTKLDQGNVLSTIRGYECSSDPTVALALEAAKRRMKQAARTSTTRLITNQRVVRFPVPDTAGYTAHFKLLALVTAHRNEGSLTRETETLFEQINFYLDYLNALKERGFAFSKLVLHFSDTRLLGHLTANAGITESVIKARVRVRDPEGAKTLLKEFGADWPEVIQDPEELEPWIAETPEYPQKHLLIQMQLLEDNVLAKLRQRHANLETGFNLHRLTGIHYYEGPCFHLKALAPDGTSLIMLGDGGYVNWTKRLLSDSRERLLTSALGTELALRLFQPEQL